MGSTIKGVECFSATAATEMCRGQIIGTYAGREQLDYEDTEDKGCYDFSVLTGVSISAKYSGNLMSLINGVKGSELHLANVFSVPYIYKKKPYIFLIAMRPIKIGILLFILYIYNTFS